MMYIFVKNTEMSIEEFVGQNKDVLYDCTICIVLLIKQEILYSMKKTLNCVETFSFLSA